MSEPSLEERVARLERLVEELAGKAGPDSRTRHWRRSVGMFDGDVVMKQIIEEGRRIRQEDRRQAGS